jgi:hypothetical protein
MEPRSPSPFLKRRLQEDAKKFIIEQAMARPRNCDSKLVLSLPESEAAEAGEVPEVFRRPAELLLYAWPPFKRHAKLFGELERAEAQVIAEAKERMDERSNHTAKPDSSLSTAD